MREDGYTFEVGGDVTRKPVRFANRFGIEVAGDLYLPAGYAGGAHAAIVVSGPFGAVKEQCSGLYADEYARRGFVALAFDPSFTGESGGVARDIASPEIFTEDYSAAVDFVGMLPYVDREKIGAQAICGLSGMALTAAATDTRIKCVATASMYDMCSSICDGYEHAYGDAERRAIAAHLSAGRWADAERRAKGEPVARGYHELPVDAEGKVDAGSGTLFPFELPQEADPVTAEFFDYYKTERGWAERSINSTSAWAASTPIGFMNFPLMSRVKMLSPRPILFVAGAQAHSLYHSREAYEAASEPKELVVVEGATHCSLYDDKEKIPFDKLEAFFRENLK